jgi:hypothetical protein
VWSGLLLASQSLGRAFAGRAGDHAQLRALGATRRQRFEIEVISLIIVAAVAALAAALIGFLGSAFTPVGSARRAEPHPGLSINLSLLAIGAGLLFSERSGDPAGNLGESRGSNSSPAPSRLTRCSVAHAWPTRWRRRASAPRPWWELVSHCSPGGARLQHRCGVCSRA